MQETVLELKNYSVSFDTPDGEVQAVRNVDLTVIPDVEKPLCAVV